MSVELTLLPFDYDQGESLSFSHTVLSCESEPDLDFDTIKALPQFEVPDDFTSYLSRDGDDELPTHYGQTIIDPYDNPVMFTTVKQLLFVMEKVQTTKNRAIRAYLAELKPRTKVALFWH